MLYTFHKMIGLLVKYEISIYVSSDENEWQVIGEVFELLSVKNTVCITYIPKKKTTHTILLDMTWFWGLFFFNLHIESIPRIHKASEQTFRTPCLRYLICSVGYMKEVFEKLTSEVLSSHEIIKWVSKHCLRPNWIDWVFRTYLYWMFLSKEDMQIT